MSRLNVTRLRGLMTAIITPFDEQGALVLSHLPALMEFQRAAGIDGLIVCGTNGEGTSLSMAERIATLEVAIAHRGDFAMIAGTGAANLPDALELTRHAARLGYDASLALPPFFYKNPTAEGLAAYFRPLLDAADLPLFLYHIPRFSAVPISHELLTLLSDHPNLAGVKDSTGDWDSTQAFVAAFPNLKIFGGSDRLALTSYQHAAGNISGGSNAFPDVTTAVRNAYQSGDMAKAEAAQARLKTLMEITSRYPLIAVSKSVLAHRGLPRLGVRTPLVNLTPAQEESLLRELRDGGYLA